MQQNCFPITLEEEMKKSYLDYAMSVIVSRAIPSVCDGLKPVHRRILFAMKEGGYIAGKPYRKSARIVGDVIGKYHPHGEAAVYDALVRMAQNFSLRIPLIDGQGNFGSIDGDPPAAMRYTESRLMHIANFLLNDIDKNTVDFMPNYDGSEFEPSVLPARFPNLLVNGSGGIAVGMATNIPPHNLGEVIDACCYHIDNNGNISDEDLLSIVQGPDFPTGGMIMGRAGIRSAYLTGRGSIIMQGKCEIENILGKQAIIINELPYMVNKAKLVEKIAELVKEKRIEGISDLRDESSREGIRVVIEIKKDIVAEVVLNQIYNYTPLRSSFGVIMLALDKSMPKIMTLRQVIEAFIDFREEVITRRTVYLLNKAREKAHLLLGQRIAIMNIDRVIAIIKAANNPAEAKENLMAVQFDVSEIIGLINMIEIEAGAKVQNDSLLHDEDDNNQENLPSENTEILKNNLISLSELQAKSILEMRLQRLTAIEKNKLEEDLNNLVTEIKEYLHILGSRSKLMSILREELVAIKEEFATNRLTHIEDNVFDGDIEDLIQKEDMVVTITLGGYIKRVPLATYKVQNRGGKGRSGLSMKDQDIVKQIFVSNTHNSLLFFSDKGQVYSLKLYKLPLGTPQAKGRPIVNLLSLREGEYITKVIALPEDNQEQDLNIVFATAKGNVRRNDISDFRKLQANGKIAIKLEEDDKLIEVRICKADEHLLMATKFGKAIRFPVSELRVFKSRSSDGVIGMKFSEKGDEVISMTVLKGMLYSPLEREQYLSIPLEERLKIAQTKNLDLLDAESKKSLSKLENINIEQIIEMAINEEFLLTVSENGLGKRSSVYEYRSAHRGGSGVLDMNVNERTGLVIGVIRVSMNDELMLITDQGTLIRCHLSSVRVTGRNTSGVILFKTDEFKEGIREKVVSVCLIDEGLGNIDIAEEE